MRPKFPIDTVSRLIARDGPYCRYCGASPSSFGWAIRKRAVLRPVAYAAGLEIDHVVPLSRGGAHDLSNFVLACRDCNHHKASKDAPPLRPAHPFCLGPREHVHTRDYFAWYGHTLHSRGQDIPNLLGTA